MSEKMIEAVTIKLPPSQLAALRAIAESEGQGMSEYIRNLIEKDIEHHRQRFMSLASIFGDGAETDNP